MPQIGQASFQSTDIASQTTIDLSGVTQLKVRITGTSNIGAITMKPHQLLFVTFIGVLTISNTASLSLPNGGNNITTQAGDRCILVADVLGNVTAWDYQRADGTALSGALSAIADKRILANVSGGSATPVPTELTTILDAIIGNAQGALLTRKASSWDILLPGVAGQFLKSAGAGQNLVYENVPGGGDMLAANNLSDVANAATAFDFIKQPATTGFAGTVELATSAETISGTDGTRAVTPSGLKAATVLAVLAADSTFWVNTAGTDVAHPPSASDPGASGSFLTWQFAYDYVAANYNVNRKTVTIKAGGSGVRTFAPASGTPVLNISAPWIGGGKFVFEGDTVTKTNVRWTSTSADCVFIGDCFGRIDFKGFQISTVTAGSGFNLIGVAKTFFTGYMYFVAHAGAFIKINNDNAYFNVASSQTMEFEANPAGGLPILVDSGYFGCPGTILVTGSRSFSGGLIECNFGAFCWIADITGSWTGPKYVIGDAAAIRSGIAESAWGGSLPGVVETGGTFIDGFNNTSKTGRHGTITNDNAAAGYLGEFIESEVLVGGAVALVSGTAKNVTSINLTPGDWDVWGLVAIAHGGTTNVAGAINTVSNTLPTSPGKGTYTQLQGVAIGTPWSNSVGQRRISVSSTTPVYLIAFCTITAGSASAYGYLGARRVR